MNEISLNEEYKKAIKIVERLRKENKNDNSCEKIKHKIDNKKMRKKINDQNEINPYKAKINHNIAQGADVTEQSIVNTAKILTTADDCVSYWWEEAVSPHLAAKNPRCFLYNRFSGLQLLETQ